MPKKTVQSFLHQDKIQHKFRDKKERDQDD